MESINGDCVEGGVKYGGVVGKNFQPKGISSGGREGGGM